jgi:phosphotriesterase-related protein
LAHEHVFFNPNGKDADDDWTLNDFDKSLQMVQEFKDNGGMTIVDASWAKESGRSPEQLKEVSQRTGVNIITCVGAMAEISHDIPKRYFDMSIQELEDLFVKDVEVGMDDTDIRAGWIKAGASYNNFTEMEERVLRAACRASKRTGAPVHVHTSTGTCWDDMLEVVADEKLPFEQFCIAHIDRNPDYWVHTQICKTGAYMIYDGPGKIKYYPDSVRIDLLRKLIEDGYGKQIMLSNDTGKRDYHKAYGGKVGTGLNYIKNKFLPRLLAEGFTQDMIDDFMIHNPARFYSLREKI